MDFFILPLHPDVNTSRKLRFNDIDVPTDVYIACKAIRQLVFLPSGTILGLDGDSSIRRVLWDLTHSEEFLNFILVLIIASCVQLAWETYATEAWENNVLAWMDIVLTVCFTLEMCCKILSNTFMDADDGYIKDSANQLR